MVFIFKGFLCTPKVCFSYSTLQLQLLEAEPLVAIVDVNRWN
jgi:hypothetical protein